MTAMRRLLEIMARLRDPEEGCPWDREQDFASIAPFTVEEAYEVDDAIRRGDMEDLKGELGDLLLQVVYHAQMATEIGAFDFEEVAAGIAEKLVRRHPHVFEGGGDATRDDVRRSWEASKARERSERASRRDLPDDPLGDVPRALPALMRAAKLQARAAEPGTSTEAPRQALLRALETLPGDSGTPRAERLGDLLFASVALARALEIDPERALRDANERFERGVRGESASKKKNA